MAFDVQAARKAGYSDAEIADYLGQSSKFDVSGARQAGYSDTDIVGHLTADARPAAPAPKPAPPKPSVSKDVGKGLASGLTQGVLGIADAVLHSTPIGMAQNALNAATGKPFGAMSAIPAVVEAFAPHANQFARFQPQTGAGRVAKTAGNMLPNAAVPGNAIARVANVVLPTVGTEMGGAVANAFGAPPAVVAGARAVGGLAGAGAGSVRMGAARGATDAAANLLASRAKVDPAQMQTRANAMNDAGVQPSLVDVIGDRGRRLVRAVGVKSDVAGETLADNARKVSATTKPAVMDQTRKLPGGADTADQAATDLRTARKTEADKDYSGPYQTQVKLEPDTITAISDEHGRAALRQARSAASARMDDAQVAEIDSLLKMNPAPDTVSAGTLDRVRIAMRNRASAMAKNNRGDVASGLGDRVRMIDQTLAQVPEIQPARANYQAKSQAIGVLGKDRKDVFSTDPQDYGKWLASLSPEAGDANKVAIRQEILDTLGGQRSSTFGSIDELASSEYAKANLRQALGPEADRYLAHISARVEQARNAGMVNPNAGSRTAVLENDLSGVKKGVSAFASAARGDAGGLAMKLGEWLLSRGVSEADAQALARAAVDPAQTQAVIRQLSSRYGAGTANQFLRLRNAGLSGALALSSQVSAAQPQPR
jgi:hypothetical protein